MAEGLIHSVDVHLREWDQQVELGLNGTLNCSEFLEFSYLSREQIRMQLDYVRGNFSADDEAAAAEKEAPQAVLAVAHVAAASLFLSAHAHIHGALAAARRECLSEHLQLLFLMSLRRLKALTQAQLRHLWVVYQGTANLLRQGAGRWLSEVVELFEADLRTMESIMVNWQDPEAPCKPNAEGGEAGEAADGNGTTCPPRRPRPGPPLPPHTEREPGSAALSTVGVLRRDSFEEWDVRKPLLRALLRYVLPRNVAVGDLCAGGGKAASFLNDTGLVEVFAFDASPNIQLLSRNMVVQASLLEANFSLWRKFDYVLCLTAAADFGRSGDFWPQVWQNVEAHALRGAVLSCGTGAVREAALAAAAAHAPGLSLDRELTARLLAEHPDICVLTRAPQ